MFIGVMIVAWPITSMGIYNLAGRSPSADYASTVAGELTIIFASLGWLLVGYLLLSGKGIATVETSQIAV